MAAPTVTAAYAGTHLRTFTVSGLLADAGEDSAATAHGLGTTPVDFSIIDTTVAGAAEVSPWAIHTVGAANFVVRKLFATTGNRTALVVLRNPHGEIR
jgi:hypothetical protein